MNLFVAIIKCDSQCVTDCILGKANVDISDIFIKLHIMSLLESTCSQSSTLNCDYNKFSLVIKL